MGYSAACVIRLRLCDEQKVVRQFNSASLNIREHKRNREFEGRRNVMILGTSYTTIPEAKLPDESWGFFRMT